MPEPTEVARFFTRARRIPILIGRTHDGAKLPGGPYTLAQVITALTVLFALWKTSALWARFGLVGNVVIFICVLVGAVLLAGRLPRTGRNPLSWAADFLSLATQAPGGTIGGRPVRLARPHHVHTRIVAPLEQREDLPTDQPVDPDAASTATPVDPDPRPRTPAPSDPQPHEQQPAQLTGVGRLLASATSKDHS